MPRPRKCRLVSSVPATTYYKPRGIPVSSLQEVVLAVEELEALRLADYMGLTQTETAKRLGVSQPTLHRVLRSARKKVADALVNGKALRISGGTYRIPRQRWFECFKCRHRWSEPYGTGRPQRCPRCSSPQLYRLAHPPEINHEVMIE